MNNSIKCGINKKYYKNIEEDKCEQEKEHSSENFCMRNESQINEHLEELVLAYNIFYFLLNYR
jgi:hypothetical protein